MDNMEKNACEKEFQALKACIKEAVSCTPNNSNNNDNNSNNSNRGFGYNLKEFQPLAN